MPVCRSFLVTFLLFLLCGCTTVPIRKEADGAPRFWPTGARWRAATVNALRDPVTWGPAAGAAVVAAGGWDKKISNWAVESTPAFGSVNSAKKASDDLRSASDLAMLGTALAVPGGNHPWWSRIKRLLVEEVGVFLASGTTNLLKRSISRERPDMTDNHSFPSGHSTRAFAYAGMSSRNLDAIDMPDTARISLRTLFTTMAAGTAWARVEGDRHYPSDVLAGASVGNFTSLLLHDAFLGREERVSASIQLDPDQRGVALRILLP
jgi:membrane-associated phospholipid phosphatase